MSSLLYIRFDPNYTPIVMHALLQCMIKHITYPNMFLFSCQIEHYSMHTLRISYLGNGKILKPNEYVLNIKEGRHM